MEQSIYEKYLIHLRDTEQRDTSRFHVSDIAGCMRKAVLIHAGVRYVPDSGMLRRGRHGTLIHADLADAMRWWIEEQHEEGILVEQDMTPWLPEGWAGRCDLDKDGLIVDYKTLHPNAMTWIKKGEYPKPNDCTQVGGYMLAKERKDGRPCLGGRLVYILLGVFENFVVYDINRGWIDEARRMMVAFDEAWKTYQTEEILPDFPPPEWKEKTSKTEAHWQQAWNCSPAYCAFAADGTCPGGPSQP